MGAAQALQYKAVPCCSTSCPVTKDMPNGPGLDSDMRGYNTPGMASGEAMAENSMMPGMSMEDTVFSEALDEAYVWTARGAASLTSSAARRFGDVRAGDDVAPEVMSVLRESDILESSIVKKYVVTRQEAKYQQGTTVYLPTTMDCQPLLEPAGPGHWKVIVAGGVAYRKTKNVGHRMTGVRGPERCKVIQGVDEGDGWIRCFMTEAEEAMLKAAEEAAKQEEKTRMIIEELMRQKAAADACSARQKAVEEAAQQEETRMLIEEDKRRKAATDACPRAEEEERQMAESTVVVQHLDKIEWMWGDVGVFGLAAWNPARWSSTKYPGATISELAQITGKDAERPLDVVIRRAGVVLKRARFNTVAVAVVALKPPALKPALKPQGNLAMVPKSIGELRWQAACDLGASKDEMNEIFTEEDLEKLRDKTSKLVNANAEEALRTAINAKSREEIKGAMESARNAGIKGAIINEAEEIMTTSIHACVWTAKGAALHKKNAAAIARHLENVKVGDDVTPEFLSAIRKNGLLEKYIDEKIVASRPEGNTTTESIQAYVWTTKGVAVFASARRFGDLKAGDDVTPEMLSTLRVIISSLKYYIDEKLVVSRPEGNTAITSIQAEAQPLQEPTVEAKKSRGRAGRGFVKKMGLPIEEDDDEVEESIMEAKRCQTRKGTGFVTKMDLPSEEDDDEVESIMEAKRCQTRKGTGFVTKMDLPSEEDDDDVEAEPAIITVTFNPGKLGIDTLGGEVTHVIDGFQGQQKGVQPGMQLMTIDGKPFSDELIREKISGTASYEVAIAFQAESKKTEAALHVGSRVRFRDRGMAWRSGVVTSLSPLKVMPNGWHFSCQWDEVKASTSHAPSTQAESCFYGPKLALDWIGLECRVLCIEMALNGLAMGLQLFCGCAEGCLGVYVQLRGETGDDSLNGFTRGVRRQKKEEQKKLKQRCGPVHKDPRWDDVGFMKWCGTRLNGKCRIVWLKVGHLRRLAGEGTILENLSDIPESALHSGIPPAKALLFVWEAPRISNFHLDPHGDQIKQIARALHKFAKDDDLIFCSGFYREGSEHYDHYLNGCIYLTCYWRIRQVIAPRIPEWVDSALREPYLDRSFTAARLFQFLYCQQVLYPKGAGFEDVEEIMEKAIDPIRYSNMKRLVNDALVWQDLKTALSALRPACIDEVGFHHWCNRARIAWIFVGYIKQCASDGGPFARRQELPPGSFVSGAPPHGLRLFVVSHVWEFEVHPNPSGSMMKKLVVKLNAAQACDSDLVFFDFMSFTQEARMGQVVVPENLPWPGAPARSWAADQYFKKHGLSELAHPTPDEKECFAAGMFELGRLFAYRRCEVIVLTNSSTGKEASHSADLENPKHWGQENLVPYENRGWCCNEFSIALYCHYHQPGATIINISDSDVQAVVDTEKHKWPQTVEEYAEMMSYTYDVNEISELLRKPDGTLSRYTWKQVEANSLKDQLESMRIQKGMNKAEWRRRLVIVDNNGMLIRPVSLEEVDSLQRAKERFPVEARAYRDAPLTYLTKYESEQMLKEELECLRIEKDMNEEEWQRRLVIVDSSGVLVYPVSPEEVDSLQRAKERFPVEASVYMHTPLIYDMRRGVNFTNKGDRAWVRYFFFKMAIGLHLLGENLLEDDYDSDGRSVSALSDTGGSVASSSSGMHTPPHTPR